MNIKTYKLETQETNIENITNVLKKHFSEFIEEPSIAETKIYFDTFDLRLLKNNIIFSCFKNQYSVEKLDEESQEPTKIITFRSAKKIKSAEDLPTHIKEELASFLNIRSLLNIFSLKEETYNISALNSDKKIVLKLKLERFVLNKTNETDQDVINLISLIPLKGYEKKLQKCEELLPKELPCTEINRKNLIMDFIEKAGNVPLDYSQKTNFNIRPEMTSSDAVKEILKTLLDIVVANEEGIINDYDSEFLHDYRVALRKTRSILSQLKNVFNLQELDYYRKEFAMIQSKSNKLRDMDVYLMNKKIYCQMLPEHLHKELEVFFNDVKRKKRKEHKIVLRMLKSPNYQNFINKWRNFLNADIQSFKGLEADTPILDIAEKYICKRYSSIIKRGKKLEENSCDEDYHAVRINCKKLRYLLELFSGLFNKENVDSVVKQLKNIQDSLGNFNDMSIQESHLNDYLHTLSGRKADNTKIAAAIGGLVTSSHNRKMEYKIEFLEKFIKFSNIKNNNLIETLFKKINN